MKLSVLVTMDDHALKHGTWGRVGVYHILEQMRKAGMHRVYWRALMGCAQAAYPSKVTDTGRHWDPDDNVFMDEISPDVSAEDARAQVEWINASLDYGEMDQLACARDRARFLGIEFGIWYEVRPEDGGVGQYSTFIKRHPELLAVARSGKRAWSELSWGEPQVMERRLGVFRELLDYQPDAILFDFLKGGDYIVPRFDEYGFWCMGYEPSVAGVFQQEMGIDPNSIPNSDSAWLEFRSRPVTQFLRQARAMQRAGSPQGELVLGAASKGSTVYFGNPRDCEPEGRPYITLLAGPMGNLEDHARWTREGLMDAFCAAHNTTSGEEEIGHFVRRKIEESKQGIRGNVRQAVEVCTYGIGSCEDEDSSGSRFLRSAAQAACESGATELVLRESCPMWGVPGIWRTLNRLAKEFDKS